MLALGGVRKHGADGKAVADPVAAIIAVTSENLLHGVVSGRCRCVFVVPGTPAQGPARAGSTPEIASEMYLASLMVVDDQNFMERAYLDELAKQLRLDPSLKAQLERQLAQPQPPPLP